MNFRYPKDSEFSMLAKLYFYEQTLFYGVDEKNQVFRNYMNRFPMWMKSHACDAFVTGNGQGICCLTPNKDGSKYIYAIWVNREFRNRGYGKALIEHARELSPKGLTLHCNTQNPKALCLYSKMGFRVSTLEGFSDNLYYRVYMETADGLKGREEDTSQFAFPECDGRNDEES